jgi:hypothetical protein
MTDLRAAAQQALEALENARDTTYSDTLYAQFEVAITALRTALAQQEQEPVAWSTRERFCEALDHAVENVRQEMQIKTVTMRRKDHDVALPIIDAYFGHVLVGDPPRREWVSLTEEEIRELTFHNQRTLWPRPDRSDVRATAIPFARAVEQACKEKNQ